MKFAIVLVVLLAASACFAEPALDRFGTPMQEFNGDPYYSHPGNLLYEKTCYGYAEYYDMNFDQYQYFVDLGPDFFEQAPGNIYWISVQAVLVFPPQWGWCESIDYWMDEGVVRSVYPFGLPDWTPLSEPLGEPVEFAFVLWGADGLPKWEQYPLVGGTAITSQIDDYWIMDSECADDFLCDDPTPIAAVTWWGVYFNGGPLPPDAFIIRFYSDVPASPVEDVTWGSIKAMYQ
jgi:hypothetical protein